MAFFRNTTVNLLNLHYSVHALAISGGGAFFAVFLLKAGVPVPGVLLAMAAILIGRFAIRPAVLPLGRRYGLKPLVIAGTIVTALQYPLLAEVQALVAPSPYQTSPRRISHGIDQARIILAALKVTRHPEERARSFP